MKNKFLLLIITLLIIVFPKVNASLCDYNEQARLNQEAANIKLTYEEAIGTYTEEDGIYCTVPDCSLEYTYLKVSILNMSKNFYIEAVNNVNNDVQTFFYSQAKDGIITFDWKDTEKVANFTLNVYSSSNTNCGGENYRVIYYTLPRYNEYFEYAICKDYPEHYLCSKFVTYDYIDFQNFNNEIIKYEEKEQEETPIKKIESIFNRIFSFIGENALTICVILIVSISTIAIIILVRKKRRRVK